MNLHKIVNHKEEMEVGQRRTTQNKTLQEEDDLYKLWEGKKYCHNTEYCIWYG